jgi:WD repeat and SOF domain-containing protein 1
LEKVFAKPFIQALDYHSDGITVLSKNRFNLTQTLSASADGEIIMWNMGERRPIFRINAHERFVRGLTFANNSQLAADTIFVSSGDDKKVQIWSVNKLKDEVEREF